MKQILLLTLEYPPDRGGIAAYLAELHALAPEVVIFRGAWWKLWPHWLPTIWQTAKIIKHRRIELLAVSHILPMGYVALALLFFKKTPYVIYTHGLDLLRAVANPWKRWWVKKILRRARWVVANSEFTATAAKKYGALHNRLKIILPSLSSLPQINNQPIVNTEPVVLSVGRLVSRKNHAAVIEAIAALRPLFCGLRYNIIGDGPLRTDLENLAAEFGVSDSVKFLGGLSDEDRARSYAEADLFVLPTKSKNDDVEGFGIVFLEAASFAKPVVAGQGGGVDEAVEHEKAGLLVDPENLDELIEAIAILLLNPEIAREFGRAGRARVEEKFLTAQRRPILEEIYG